MTPEEFETLKNEEKAHLRQLRDLKQQHREVQRKTSILGALRDMDPSALTADTEARTDSMMRASAMQDARLGLAMEDEAAREKADADREALRQAEAAELVRQLKAESGATLAESPTRASAPAGAEARTIGRTPPPETPDGTTSAAATEAPPGAKTLGRPRG